MGERESLNEIPEICDFFGVRKTVLKRAMGRMKEKKAAGEIVTNKLFSGFMKEEWAKAKMEAEKVCYVP